jgi:hypothetical protein
MKRERATLAVVSHRKAGSVDGRSHEECAVLRKRLRGLHVPQSQSHLQPPQQAPQFQQQQQQQQAAAASMSMQSVRMRLADFCEVTPFDRDAVAPEELAAWVAEMAADFFSELSVLYDMLSDVKAPSSEARAMDELMRRMGYLLEREASASGGEDLASRWGGLRNVYSGLVRVYIFLFQRYHREFVVLEVGELLAACWHRLLAFAMEHRLLDDEFLRKVYEHVAALVDASGRLVGCV